MKPSERKSTIDLYFLEARARLIDLAAFMDRVEREGETDDFRYQAFLQALKELEKPNRAKATLLAFSDPTTEPAPRAMTQFACGAWKGEES